IGKSCLILRFALDDFNPDFQLTIGVEVSHKFAHYERPPPNTGRFLLGGGRERYRAVSSTDFNGAVGVPLVYDITKRSSFESVCSWLNKIRDHSSRITLVMLIAHTYDLDPRWKVSTEMAMRLATESGLYIVEPSALDSTHVDLAFQSIFPVITLDAHLLARVTRSLK
ncbi:P-loop containing nucleoside triphosphate hydrolase protein, partial [Basidiobolus meristosporus CBS 931.73]